MAYLLALKSTQSKAGRLNYRPKAFYIFLVVPAGVTDSGLAALTHVSLASLGTPQYIDRSCLHTSCTFVQYPVVYIANATTSQSLLTSFRDSRLRINKSGN